MSLVMSKEEREAFLAEVHVGVISIERKDRAPLSAPIWYGYEPGGELWIVTGGGSRKGRALEAAGRFTLVAQTEDAPYRYVSVEGEVVANEPADVERDTRPLAHRYLGPEIGDQYIAATRDEQTDNRVIRMRPQRWLSTDYRKQFGGG